jgi:peptide/nickel transport system permease protein
VATFIFRRLLLAIPVMLGVTFLVFVLARLIPSDPCRATLGEKATDAICRAFAQRHGLDQPIPVQFVVYLGNVLQGDLGSSLKFGRPVTDLLFERMPLTLELTLFALIFAIIVGIPLGIISAYKRNSPADVGTMIVANLGVSTPVFVLGLVFAFLFAVVLRDTPFALPPSGRIGAGVVARPIVEVWGWQALQGPPRAILDFLSNMYTLNGLLTLNFTLFGDAFRHMILPMVALGTIPLAIIARMTRSSLLEVLGLDYIRTARAKGLRDRLVVLRHGVRNAMLPVVTVIGLSFGALLSGAVLTETVFNLTGIGRTLFEAIGSRDYAVVQATTLVIGFIFVTVNLAVDVIYAVLDPRIRVG